MVAIYVDASRPDDTGNGLTPGTAKRTLRGARLAAAAHDEVLVRRGYCYDPLNGRFYGSTSAYGPIRFSTYGEGAKPIWDALNYEAPSASGWSLIVGSGGVWKKTFGSFYVRRVFAASTNNGILAGQRTIGSGLRRAVINGVTTLPTSNPTEAQIVAGLQGAGFYSPWSPGGAATSYSLYMWTGSVSITPPEHFQGLAFIQADGASIGCIHGIEQESTGSQWRVEDQEIRGCGGYGIRQLVRNSSPANNPGIQVIDCKVTHVWQGAVGVYAVGELSPTRRISGGFCKRVYGDGNYYATETEDTTLMSSFSGVCDMFFLGDRVDNYTVDNCDAINAGHNGYWMGSLTSGETATQPSNCSVLNSRAHFDIWHPYGRGIASSAGVNLRFDRLTITGQNTRSQITGDTIVSNSRWLGCRPAIRKAGTDQWLATESYIYDNGSGAGASVRYVPVSPVNVRIVNNYAEGIFASAAIHWNSYANVFGIAPTWPANAVTIANNIVVGGSLVLQATDGGGNSPVIPSNTVRNNVYFSAGASSAGRVIWKGTSHTVNTAPGFLNNSEVDPKLTNDLRPLPNSSLLRAGVYMGYMRDAAGIQRPNPPSIGAYDIATFRSLPMFTSNTTLGPSFDFSKPTNSGYLVGTFSIGIGVN